MKEEIYKALEVLKAGGIILYPTDTVWGIGCDASNSDAVQKIYALKQRTEAKALITLVSNEVMLERTVIGMPEIAWELLEASDTPLTIIYEQVKGIAKNALAEDGSCAIRLPKNDFCQRLAQRLGKPLISTSANISESPTPKSFQDIDAVILSGVDYVVNLQQNESSQKPSSIIQLKNNGQIKIIR
jgi:L-threonylcarbamoyladenylate synthase